MIIRSSSVVGVGFDVRRLLKERFAAVSRAWNTQFQSWLFAEIDPQLLALFFEELLLDDELANFAFQALLLFLFESERGLRVILACKDLRHTSFQFFLPLAHLCWGQLVGLGNLVDRFEALKGFDGDSCFEFRCEVSSLSLHFVCFTWVDHRRRAFEISIATWLHLGLPLQYALQIPTGATYDIQFSADLISWDTIAEGITGSYTDQDAARVRLEEGHYRGALK